MTSSAFSRRKNKKKKLQRASTVKIADRPSTPSRQSTTAILSRVHTQPSHRIHRHTDLREARSTVNRAAERARVCEVRCAFCARPARALRPRRTWAAPKWSVCKRSRSCRRATGCNRPRAGSASFCATNVCAAAGDSTAADSDARFVSASSPLAGVCHPR